MRRSAGLLLMTILFMAYGAVYAEGGCPPGQTPTQYGANIGCAPGGNDYSEGGNVAPAPSGQWNDRFGAIANDDAKSAIGVAANYSSDAFAQSVAVSDCQEKGGTQCQILVAYKNGCAVMVKGEARYQIRSASTLAEAMSLAMTDCNAEDQHCLVGYADCSLPVFISY